MEMETRSVDRLRLVVLVVVVVVLVRIAQGRMPATH